MKTARTYTKMRLDYIPAGDPISLIEQVQDSEFKRAGVDDLNEWLCLCPGSPNPCLVWVADKDITIEP